MTPESPNDGLSTQERREDESLGSERRQRGRAFVWGPTGRPVTEVARDTKARHPSGRTSSFARGSLSVGAAAVGLMTGAVGIVVPPAHADDYPSWNDVQQAKQSVKDKQTLVDKIGGLIGDLQKNADTLGIAADKAAEAYLVTKGKLDDATATAADLQRQSKAAAKTAQTSVMRAGLLASHLAQSGDSSLGLLLSGGDAKSSDRLLYQLGTMSQLTQQSDAIYQQALKDKNTAKSLADQAELAEKTRKRLADAAAADLKSAQNAAAAAQTAVVQQKSKQAELVTQLASLQNTSLQVAQKFADGVAFRARQQATQHAAPPPPPAQAAGGSGGGSSSAGPSSGGSSSGGSTSGGSSSGGSGTSSGGSSGGAPSSGGGSVGAPNRSAVETAISYAYAHIGAPYALGGAGPKYYDCSGLVMMAYAAAGIYVGTHSVTNQFYTAQSRGQLVPLSQRQRGDIIFWYDGVFYHDAIYLGNNQIIAARDYGEPLAVQGLWGSPYPYVARPSA